MCNNSYKIKCYQEECNDIFSREEDLINYKKYLEQELEIVNKILKDINEETWLNFSNIIFNVFLININIIKINSYKNMLFFYYIIMNKINYRNIMNIHLNKKS